MGKNGTEVDDHILLFEAVREAELLLDYISRQGLEFDTKTASAIVKAKHLFAAGNWAPQDETDFWAAYNAAAKGAAPVTVASIKAAIDPPTHSLPFKIVQRLTGGKFKASAARWYAMRYGLCTSTILLALIVVQIYWSSGANMLDRIEKHRKELDTSWTAVSALRGEIGKPQEQQSAETKKVLEQLRRERTIYEADLKVFKKYWSPLLTSNNDDQQADKHEKGGEWRRDAHISNLASVGIANLGLQMIQANILPLLYGLLGSAAYVLRTLSVRIRNVTYVPTANTGFGLRMQLGTLAGLAIGWFYKPDGLVNSSLSPFALAFLAGYSVELFFTAMDKFVLAFSNSPVRGQKKADKTLPDSQVGGKVGQEA
ncbi:MAG: hypothetical protein HZB33_00505 [Nitrospirae bacterium]|nr:hypothetical protein [Nitrospirota bacterium]